MNTETNKVPNTPDELRQSLGMKADQLLCNGTDMADILWVKDGYVGLGIISTGKWIKVPLSQILPREPFLNQPFPK